MWWIWNGILVWVACVCEITWMKKERNNCDIWVSEFIVCTSCKCNFWSNV